MSLGLPSHLARVTLSEAFQKAMHAIAFASLLGAALVVVAFMADRPQLVLWPALAAVAAMVVALWLNDRYESVLFDVSYLVVGAAGVYWYSITFYTQLAKVVAADSIWLSLPKVAVIMVAGAGVSAWAASAWVVSGYVVAETIALLAAVQLGLRSGPDGFSLIAAAVTIIAILLSVVSRFRARQAQPKLHRAAREERLAALRAGLELKAAALLHDTVLSHLAAIANTPKTELTPELAEQIRRDLEILVGEEWLREVEQPAVPTGDFRKSPLFLAIQEAKLQGLEVAGTGDISAVLKLDRARSTALGLATKQCLANVIKHSGTMKAEVAVYGSDSEVSVMIVDEGRGFEVAEVGSDRLGLRASVRRRIESAGGTVQVWSSPGNGTSVLIRVPVAAPAAVETVSADVPAEPAGAKPLADAEPAGGI